LPPSGGLETQRGEQGAKRRKSSSSRLTMASTLAAALEDVWIGTDCADDSVPFAHAKVGYRHAIFKRKTPGSRECRGFLFRGRIWSFPVTLAACVKRARPRKRRPGRRIPLSPSVTTRCPTSRSESRETRPRPCLARFLASHRASTPLAAAGIVDRASPRAKYAAPEAGMARANPGKAAIGRSTGETGIEFPIR
jgi:hypothetical protein